MQEAHQDFTGQGALLGLRTEADLAGDSPWTQLTFSAVVVRWNSRGFGPEEVARLPSRDVKVCKTLKAGTDYSESPPSRPPSQSNTGSNSILEPGLEVTWCHLLRRTSFGLRRLFPPAVRSRSASVVRTDSACIRPPSLSTRNAPQKVLLKGMASNVLPWSTSNRIARP